MALAALLHQRQGQATLALNSVLTTGSPPLSSVVCLQLEAQHSDMLPGYQTRQSVPSAGVAWYALAVEMLALTLGIGGSQAVHQGKTLAPVVVVASHNSVQAKNLLWEIVAAQGTTMVGAEKVPVQKQQRGPEAVVQQRRGPVTVEPR